MIRCVNSQSSVDYCLVTEVSMGCDEVANPEFYAGISVRQLNCVMGDIAITFLREKVLKSLCLNKVVMEIIILKAWMG